MADIEYFYSAHSAYAYLGSTCFMDIARAADRKIKHRPMDLRRVIEINGPGATNGLTPARRSYFSGREIERWAEYRAAPVMEGFPTHHSEDITLPNCMVIAGIQQGVDVDRLAHCMLKAHWRDDADLSDRETLAQLGRKAGVDPEPLLAAALSADVQAAYAANTEEAIRRSVFGSPTYFVDGDMFYG
ncbi:MAG: 2-hydroxychromene-2-carboxylate isomerase [Alphaproteobacteria bacterium]|nr:2-hydroxychromene-2-carboxylate isomerase [Alphaproteobacteria bacterium]